jgi:endonuclease-8
MPEGHSIRHFASLHHHAFVGSFIEASSPQGRFSDEASKLTDRIMTRTTAYGKHLFLHFDEDIVHIHLGLYGWFDLYKNKGQVPKESVRLRIESDAYLSDLRGPTMCALIPFDDLAKTIAKLGPDPLRDDADPEKAWTKIHKSSKTIGALLMDQAVIAGIGNVYRAELLFLSNLSPFTPGMQVTRDKFDEIWANSVRLLSDGATDGRIRTVSKEHISAEQFALHGDKHYSYVYKRTNNSCLVCGNAVSSSDLAGRTVYWCGTCQHD